VEDKTVALSFKDFRGLAASSEIAARPKSHQAFHVYLANIAQYFGSKRLTEWQITQIFSDTEWLRYPDGISAAHEA